MNCELTKESRIGDKVSWSNKDGTFEGELVDRHCWYFGDMAVIQLIHGPDYAMRIHGPDNAIPIPMFIHY